MNSDILVTLNILYESVVSVLGLAVVNCAPYFDMPVQASCNALQHCPLQADNLSAAVS
jgi:hypothetical protein